MNNHIKSIHKGNKPVQCDTCDTRFAQKGNKKKHIALIHDGKKIFNCFCESNFKLKSDLKKT